MPFLGSDVETTTVVDFDLVSSGGARFKFRPGEFRHVAVAVDFRDRRLAMYWDGQPVG